MKEFVAFPSRHSIAMAFLVPEFYSNITYDVIAIVTSVANHHSRARA
jgi:hypothetical protein